jgi:hypothetical protein
VRLELRAQGKKGHPFDNIDRALVDYNLHKNHHKKKDGGTARRGSTVFLIISGGCAASLRRHDPDQVRRVVPLAAKLSVTSVTPLGL